MHIIAPQNWCTFLCVNGETQIIFCKIKKTHKLFKKKLDWTIIKMYQFWPSKGTLKNEKIRHSFWSWSQQGCIAVCTNAKIKTETRACWDGDNEKGPLVFRTKTRTET